MEIPKALLQRLKDNEAIAKKFNEIEISILSILNYHDFLERLLVEISEKFFIPYIWISIIKESPIALHIKDIQNSDLLKKATTFVPRQTFQDIIKNQLTPILANEDLDIYQALLPEIPDCRIGSIAIAPITLDGRLVGSINQADTNKNRFEPGIDTSLLEQLALKVSLCLSNVTAHEQLKYLAYHDPLTGLLNRGVMERVLDRELQRAARYGLELSIIFLDLDEFKAINDTFGHDSGDSALCLLADTLTAHKRDSDVVARFAGDEFVAILPSTDKAKADHFIQRVKNHLAATPLSCLPENTPPCHLQLSHGISSLSEIKPPLPEDRGRTLLKMADKRLYRAKQRKNDVR